MFVKKLTVQKVDTVNKCKFLYLELKGYNPWFEQKPQQAQLLSV